MGGGGQRTGVGPARGARGASASGGSSEERSLRQHTFLAYVLCPRTAASSRAMRLLRLRKDGLSDDGYLEAVGAFSGDASW